MYNVIQSGQLASEAVAELGMSEITLLENSLDRDYDYKCLQDRRVGAHIDNPMQFNCNGLKEKLS